MTKPPSRLQTSAFRIFFFPLAKIIYRTFQTIFSIYILPGTLYANSARIIEPRVDVADGGVVVVLDDYLFPSDSLTTSEPNQDSTFFQNLVDLLSFFKNGVMVFQHFLARSNVSKLLSNGTNEPCRGHVCPSILIDFLQIKNTQCSYPRMEHFSGGTPSTGAFTRFPCRNSPNPSSSITSSPGICDRKTFKTDKKRPHSAAVKSCSQKTVSYFD